MAPVKQKSYRLWTLMVTLTLVTMVFCLGLIYITVLKNKKADLKAHSVNQRNIISLIYKATGDRKKTLIALQEFFTNDPTFGKTGEYLIGTLDHDTIKYLIDVKHPPSKGFNSIPVSSGLATPMRNALSGITGTMFGHDYRGKHVLAYTAYIPELNWGLVTKMDLKEVLSPFLKAGLLVLFVTLILIVIGSKIFKREFSPIFESIKINEERFRNLFEYSADPIWEIDASGIREYFDRLTSSGITDISAYLESDDEWVGQLVSMLKVINVNHRSRIAKDKNFNRTDLTFLLNSLNHNTIGAIRKVFTGLYNGHDRIETEIEFLVEGEPRSYLAHVSVLPGHEKSLDEVITLFVDITTLKEYQEKLLRSESILKKSQEIAHLGSWEL
ncbi:MAG TPA: hypothetical protein VK155_05620, partial [Bacteroidales bacterium]|nr:hypothetical protein [Bacteroidales bacterium]